MANTNRFQDKFSVNKIGTGKFFVAGNLTSRARRGLAGALRQTKSAGMHSYARNLSQKDLGTFQKLLGEEMSQLSNHSQGLNRQARLRIMTKAEKLRQQGTISAEDKKDLRQIVEALGANTNKQTTRINSTPVDNEPKQRATQFITDRLGQRQTDPNAKHIRTNIAIDISNEVAAEERGETSLHYDPRSVLGRSRIIDQLQKEQEEKDKQSKKSTGQISGSSRFDRTQSPKTKAPNLTNLPDMGIDFGN